MFEVEDSWCEGSSSEQQLHHALFGSQLSRAKKKRAHGKKTYIDAEVQTKGLHSQTPQELDPPVAKVTDKRVGRKRKTKSRTRESTGEEGRQLKRSRLDAEDGTNPGADEKLKRREKHGKHDPKQASRSLPRPETRKKVQASSKLHSRMTSKMEGARFRWINEQLYTTTGDEAKELFQNDPELFSVYHRGFTAQVSKWPQDPLGAVIAYVSLLPTDTIVVDFGCGEARLAQSVPHTVHSFDLVACNKYVTACDMAHIPLPQESVDVAVFCLSLMGTNTSDFIKEARRVLKKEGRLKIIEIVSRFSSLDRFISVLGVYGFQLLRNEPFSKMFVDLEFKLVTKKSRSSLPEIRLKPCFYKRR